MQNLNRPLLIGVSLAWLTAGIGCATGHESAEAHKTDVKPAFSIAGGSNCQTDQAYYNGVAVKAATPHCLLTGDATGYLEFWKKGLLTAKLGNRNYILSAVSVRLEAMQRMDDDETPDGRALKERLVSNMNRRVQVLQAKNAKIDLLLKESDLPSPPSVQVASVKPSAERRLISSDE